MEDLLYGPQVIDRMMQKPEFIFLGKYYHLLYQSLIPNCSLTIKVLRQHLSISHGVELYILNGASRRLCCQRLVNFLLVHLDDVKDYAQFCDHLNLVSVLNDLPNRLIAEFRANIKWGGTVAHHPGLAPNRKEITAHQTSHDPNRAKLNKDIKSIDHESCHSDNLVEDSVRVEDINVPFITDDDNEASVYKADRSSISDHHNTTSRRLVVTVRIQTVKPSESGDVTSSADTAVVERRSLRMPISLELEFMLSSSEWSIVDTFFSPLCDCLPQDYHSTIAKLKSFPQFAGMEHQCQLNSLIPPALTDISIINEKILTFLVMNLCYNTNSGGITKLCDVMEQLIEFSECPSCVQEIRCAVSDSTANLPLPTTTSSLSQSTDSVDQACDADMAPSTPVAAVPAMSSYAVTNASAGVSPTNGDETDTSVLGLQLLTSNYQVILQSLPMDYENTLNLLQNYLTDNQLCQILDSSSYSTANKVILDSLIEKFKESVNIPELCKKLELIASLSTSKQLSSIVNELKEVTSPKTTQEQPPSAEELKLPQVLTVDEDFAQLKTHYHTILHLMPDDYEQSVGRLQNHFSDDQICAILYCGNRRTANKLILDSLIERMSCKEDQLDLCDQLEKIPTASNELKVIIQQLRSGVEYVPNASDKGQPEVVAASYGIMYNMAFSDLRVDPSSKVVAVLKKNYDGLCDCLPKDSLVTIKRIKQNIPQAIEGVENQLISLTSDAATNAMIIVLFIKHLNNETAALSLCDILEDLVDDGAPKKFIHTLRSEVIEALSDENATTEEVYFDRLIFSHMTDFQNPNVLAILKKHCSKLCNCLSDDFMKTLDRIRLRATVPEGLVHQLATLPSPKHVNHHIMAAMLRPLTNVAGVLGFCDTFECVLDDEQSRKLIESIRNEICEALSCPTATTTVTNTTTTTTTATNININTPTTNIATTITTTTNAAAVVSTNIATTANTAPTTAMATTVNMIKPITFNESVPLPTTTEHLAADHNSTGTETSGTSTNTQAGISGSSVEVVSTDTLTE